MKNIPYLYAFLAGIMVTFLFPACTDATLSSVGALGSQAHITCYSGGTVIYDGDSSGRIATVDGSDGWEFRDAKTLRFVRVSGACVIRN